MNLTYGNTPPLFPDIPLSNRCLSSPTFVPQKETLLFHVRGSENLGGGDNTEMKRGTNCGTLDYPQPSSRSLAMKDPGCLINRPQSASTPRTINLPVRREVSSSSRILYRGHLNGMKLNLFVIAIGMIFLFIVFNLTVYNLLIQECRA